MVEEVTQKHEIALSLGKKHRSNVRLKTNSR